MSEALVLEFSGVSADQYKQVNEILGVDPISGAGDWPEGLTSHTGASHGDDFMVFEIWDSQDAAQNFMETRLGAALGKAGVPEPRRAEWLSLEGHHEA